MHAFTIDTKGQDIIKTYYIVTAKSFRGRGIAKDLTMDILNEYKNTNKKYFVNSEENSDGAKFYKKLFKNNYTVQSNDFNTCDLIFKSTIKDLLDQTPKNQ